MMAVDQKAKPMRPISEAMEDPRKKLKIPPMAPNTWKRLSKLDYTLLRDNPKQSGFCSSFCSTKGLDIFVLYNGIPL